MKVLPLILDLFLSLWLSWLAVVFVVVAFISVGNLIQFERSWNTFWLTNNVERLVDLSRNRLDLGSEFLFNFVQVESIVPVDEVDGDTEVSKSTRSTNSVQISFCSLGEVEIHHHVDCLNIDTSGKQVRTNQVSDFPLSELVEDLVSCSLRHLGVGVVARVVKFCDFLGEKLHSVGGVAENDRLVDLQFGKESVQAVQFLLLLHKGIILGDTLQGKFVHQINFVRLVEMLVHK
ncbi:hypothetical protein OGATHE_001277 [Ogataea polymorpha]|uniref:Uncharacterized protein n=1 Tax=Ogataea polymorpha TaxID=460523 RepID=A0A9P8PR56_9ASCO|nr:hypothetical protein OGATHE_001277 [Ogataea polymorpha]